MLLVLFVALLFSGAFEFIRTGSSMVRLLRSCGEEDGAVAAGLFSRSEFKPKPPLERCRLRAAKSFDSILERGCVCAFICDVVNDGVDVVVLPESSAITLHWTGKRSGQLNLQTNKSLVLVATLHSNCSTMQPGCNNNQATLMSCRRIPYSKRRDLPNARQQEHLFLSVRIVGM